MENNIEYHVNNIICYSPNGKVKGMITRIYMTNSYLELLLDDIKCYLKTSIKTRNFTGIVCVPVTMGETTHYPSGDYISKPKTGNIYYEFYHGEIKSIVCDEILSIPTSALK